MRSRTAGVMTTLMRNGRDRRLEKPVKCHARKERVFLVGTRSADHIRASGHSGCIQRPDTWLHPNASLKCQIPLAPRAPSIHGTFETCRQLLTMSVVGGRPEVLSAQPKTTLLTPSRTFTVLDARLRAPTECGFRLTDTANHEVLSGLAPAGNPLRLMRILVH